MADKEISGLTAATTPLAGTELVHIDQGGNSRKVALTDVVAIATGAMLKATYDPNDDGVIAVAQGGTGGATASAARTNLGLGTMAVQNAATVAITGGSVTGITDIAVADGGTGASDASGARTNLGLVIGTDVQAYSANLAGFAATTVANVQNRVNHTGTQLAATISDFSTAADARVSAAIGSTVQAYSANLDGWSALATASKLDASVIPSAEDGKILSWTGSSLVNKTAGELGVFVVGEDVQAWSANLDSWSALATSAKQDASANLTTIAANGAPGATGLSLLLAANAAGALTTLGVSAFIQTLLNDADASAALATLSIAWDDGGGGPAKSIKEFLDSMIVNVASYCDDDENVSAWADVQRAFDDGEGKITILPARRYKSLTRADGTLNLPKRGVVIFAPGAILDTTAWAASGTPHEILMAQGDTPTAVNLSGNPSGTAAQGANVIQLTSTASISEGQYCLVVSNAFFTTEDGSVGTKGEWVRAAAKGENRILQSQTFDNASWVKTNATVTADAATSPLGNTTADKIVATAVNSSHSVNQSFTFATATTYTASVYAKAGEEPWLRIELPATAFTSALGAYFDLTNGTIGTTSAGATADIEALDNGWYRCSVTATSTAAAAGNIRLYIADADNDVTWTGDGVGGFYLWGAQLEVASTPGFYFVTTTATVTNAVRIYGNLRDSYAEADTARVYPMADLVELTVINPQIEGCGRFDDGATGDRGIWLVNGKNCHVIGGSIEGSDQLSLIFSNIYGGSVDGVYVRQDQRADATIVAYGPHLANNCENIQVKNCDITGCSEALGLTATGGIQGITRDCSFLNNHVRGAKRSGVNTHDAHQGILIEGNIIEDCEQGIETRVIDTVIRGNIIRRMGKNSGTLNTGISIGDGAGKIVIQGNTIEDVLRGVYMDDDTPHEFTPGDIDIEGNTFRNIGALGVALYYTTGGTDALGTVTVRDNTFDGDGSTALRGVDLEGKWKPIITNNTFRNGNTGRCIYVHATDNGAGTNGPVNPVIMGNVWDSSFTDILIQHGTGRFLVRNNNQFDASALPDVASASALTLDFRGDIFNITGTTTINTIGAANNGGAANNLGRTITLQFNGSLTVTNNANAGAANDIQLSGAANFSATANDILTLFSNGTIWREISRTTI